MTAPTRFQAVRDALAARIDATWTPRGAADEVIARTRIDIDSATLEGRKLYVFRATLGTTLADRAEDQNDYTLAVLVVERYEPADDPPEDWIDDRVAWMEWLLNVVGNARAPRLLAEPGRPDDTGLWPEEAEITTVTDPEELVERKLFSSLILVKYREHEDAPVTMPMPTTKKPTAPAPNTVEG